MVEKSTHAAWAEVAGKLVGKIPQILAWVFLIIVALRAPASKLPEVAKAVLATPFMVWAGWSLAGIAILVLIGMSYFGRRFYKEEISRIARERDELQEKLLNDDVSHSGREPS